MFPTAWPHTESKRLQCRLSTFPINKQTLLFKAMCKSLSLENIDQAEWHADLEEVQGASYLILSFR